jgi:RecA-family ATPase
MLMSMAMGCPWMGFDVAVPVKCGLVSREDNPALTAWRFKHIFSGKKTAHPVLIESNLYINSRQQTDHFFLDNETDVIELIADIKRLGLEFVMLDVLNRLHSADENDNTEMAKIMAQVTRIQQESGAAIGIVHHLNKAADGNITQRLRGAGAIAGFAEWLIDAHIVDEEQKVRQMQFEIKAACPPDPIYWKIEGDEMAGIIRLSRVEYEPHEQIFARKLQRI